MFRGVLFFHVHLVDGWCHHQRELRKVCLKLFTESVHLRNRLSEAEAEMDRRTWEQRNAYIALCETKRQFDTQRLELFHANQWLVRLKEGVCYCDVTFWPENLCCVRGVLQ